MSENRFLLETHQVPAPCITGSWSDVLRWCIAVMDADDADLPFIASLLPHALRHGRISLRHLNYAGPVVQRLWSDHAKGRLACQQHPVPPSALHHASAVAGNA